MSLCLFHIFPFENSPLYKGEGDWTCKVCRNRPFYQYDGHIELIRFKEYNRMPRGHEHISFVFSGTFRDIFSLSFLRIRL